MSDTLHIVCPHCHTTNRIATAHLGGPADCGRCHQVFEAYFAGPQGGQVVAVRIPHVPGQTYVKTDQPEDIACEGCERLALPEGTRWVITSPTIVRFQGGTVDCVTSADYSRCRQGSGELP